MTNSFTFNCGDSIPKKSKTKTIPLTLKTTHEFSVSVNFENGKRVVTSSEPISDAAVDLIFPPWIQEMIKNKSWQQNPIWYYLSVPSGKPRDVVLHQSVENHKSQLDRVVSTPSGVEENKGAGV